MRQHTGAGDDRLQFPGRNVGTQDALDLGAEGIGVRRIGALFELQIGTKGQLYPCQLLVRDEANPFEEA